jgi:hypothetical protein
MNKCYYSDKTADFMYLNGYCGCDCSECMGIGIAKKRVTVKIASQGFEGNIYQVLAYCKAALGKVGKLEEYNALRGDVTNSGSYREAIARIRRDVNLIDLDGEI